MKTKLHTKKIFLAVLVIFILSCGPTAPILLTPTNSVDGSTLPATESQTATLPPSVAPTATVYPPVFDPDGVGDNRVLDSFVLSKTETIRGNSDAGDWDYWDAIGYIKEPAKAYHTSGFSFSSEKHESDSYFLIDGALYTKDGSNGPPWYYYVHPVPDPGDVDYYLQGAADMRQGDIMLSHLVLSAQFAAQEDYEGIPANHFTLDQTNLSHVEANFTGIVGQAQGDLYLAQAGNYLLYFHLKMTGPEGVRELTEKLTSINQLTEIALPTDFPVFELDPGLPLPADTILHSVQTDEARDSDFYDYFTPATVSQEEFLDFYRNMAPTNGWTVSQAGPMPEPTYCSTGCVILNKGNAQATLFRPELCVSTMPMDDVCMLAEYVK